MKAIFFLSLLFAHVLQADGTAAAAERLAKAARAGDFKTLENLLSSGVSPDLPDQFGRAPISYAASFDQAKAVELLLAYHADPNPRAYSSKYAHQMHSTPLQSAAELGNRRIASLLIAAGARVNEKGPAGRTALHCANDQLDVVKLLIDNGADLNARDVEGASPLDEAVWYGSFDTVALLLANGARLNESESKTGATPINEAAYKGHTRLVQYLLQFKPDIESPDKHGYGPLDNAMRMWNEEAALLLLEAEAPGKETPEFFEKALATAIRKDESALVENLLRHGANANGTLPLGGTPLDTAAFGGSAKVVGVLLKNGADPNLEGRNGNSPLEDASLKGFDAIVGMLLDRGALVNRIGAVSGATALYSAASFGQGAVVELLLKRGANPNLCVASHKSHWTAAFENGYTAVAQQIQQNGGKRTCETR